VQQEEDVNTSLGQLGGRDMAPQGLNNPVSDFISGGIWSWHGTVF
jgi:hypothetical protein